MLNKTYMFKTMDFKAKLINEISTKDEQDIDDSFTVLNWTSGLQIYCKKSNSFEPIIKVKREDTEITKEKYKLAHKKLKYANHDLLDKYFNGYNPFMNKETEVYPEYLLEYDEEQSKTLDPWEFNLFSKCESNITFTTENSGDITVDLNKTVFTGSERLLDKYIVTTKSNVIEIMEFLKIYNNDPSKLVDYEVKMMSLNLKTGLTYLNPDKLASTKKDKIKNITTGEISNFLYLPDIVCDKVIEIIADYNNEKFGKKPICTKLNRNIDTIRSFNFNPYSNIMYLYKPFFNTRFRTYFKRDDISTNHFEEMCNMLNIPFSNDYLELCAKNSKVIFLAKCLYDAGIKKQENIFAMLNVLDEHCWDKDSLYNFIDKYYGDKTDFLYMEDKYYHAENIRENLYKYIVKALPYTSEDEFVKMFVRSFVQHNKYWKRSLHQVATLIDLNDFSRELMRKACSYGLNKIQSDNIDLAYDKVILKNKFIQYSENETDCESIIGDFIFKLPLDMQEVRDYVSDLIDDKTSKEMSLDAARKFYTVMLVKDNYGEMLAIIKFRGNMLLSAEINSSASKFNRDEIKEKCIEWCDANDIKQYRCKDLKKSTSGPFSLCPF